MLKQAEKTKKKHLTTKYAKNTKKENNQSKHRTQRNKKSMRFLRTLWLNSFCIYLVSLTPSSLDFTKRSVVKFQCNAELKELNYTKIEVESYRKQN